MASVKSTTSTKKKETTSTSSGSGTSSSTKSSASSTTTPAYDVNTDYSKLIADAAAKGDYKSAAQYEQLRNEKIAGTGSSYAQTNNYAGWLDTDYSILGQQQMADGASWQDVLTTYNNRNNKATTTAGLEQYANDDIQRQMWEYIQNGIAAEGNPENYMDDFSYGEEKPTYSSQYDPAIQELLNQILNREDFSYNAQSDPLYQQYESTYRREGDRAMRDTMAEAAASAGGMNSYAMTAAQQANNYYMSQLGDKIPELYQLAYQMYLQDKESDVQDLGILQSMDATQYGRYRDTISDYYADKNFAYNQYMDAVNRGQWEKNFAYNQAVNDRNFSYGVAQDTLSNQWKEKDWNNAINQQTIQNNRYDAEWNRDEERYQSEQALLAQQEARSWAEALIAQGVMPSNDVLAAAGISAVDASAYIASVKAQQAAKASSSSSTSTKKKTTEDDKPIVEDDSPVVEDDVSTGISYGSVINLGLGMITDEDIAGLLARGAVEMDEKGKVTWADGWNAERWKGFSSALNPVIGLPF